MQIMKYFLHHRNTSLEKSRIKIGLFIAPEDLAILIPRFCTEQKTPTECELQKIKTMAQSK